MISDEAVCELKLLREAVEAAAVQLKRIADHMAQPTELDEVDPFELAFSRVDERARNPK